MKALSALTLVALLFALFAAGPAPAAEPDPIVAQATGEGAYVLAEFVSKTCTACDEMRPVVASVLAGHPQVRHQVHDADLEIALAKKYKVRCVPVYVIVDPGGQVRFNDVGMRTREELEEILRGAGAR